MNDRTPYLYLIEWTSLNKKYVGVRYAKGCNPSDLCKKYFTSSVVVKQFIKDNGNPDKIIILQTFSDIVSAKNAEDDYLREHKVNQDNSYLNIKGDSFKNLDVRKVKHYYGKENPIHKYLENHREEFCRKTSEGTKKAIPTSENYKRAHQKGVERFKSDKNPGRHEYWTDERRKKLSDSLKEHYENPDNRLIGSKNPMYGKHMSEANKKNLSIISRACRLSEINVCPKCGRTIKTNGNFARHLKWHQNSI